MEFSAWIVERYRGRYFVFLHFINTDVVRLTVPSKWLEIEGPGRKSLYRPAEAVVAEPSDVFDKRPRRKSSMISCCYKHGLGLLVINWKGRKVVYPKMMASVTDDYESKSLEGPSDGPVLEAPRETSKMRIDHIALCDQFSNSHVWHIPICAIPVSGQFE